MKSKSDIRSSRRARSTLDLACRGIFIGGALLATRGLAQESFYPNLSTVGIVYNPATNYLSQNLAAPTPPTVPVTLSGNELFNYNNPITCLTYQLDSSYYLVNSGNTLTTTAPNNSALPATSAYASVGESDSFSIGVGAELGVGTGISQGAVYGTSPDPATLSININNLAFYVNASPSNPFPNSGIKTQMFQFGVGGQLPQGASAEFNMQLTYTFYATNTPNSFSFANQTGTPMLLSPFSLDEQWTNTLSSLMSFSNELGNPQYPDSGSQYLIGAQSIKTPGFIDITGNITFTAKGGGSLNQGMMAQSQSGGGSNQPTPAGFAIYLPQTASVGEAQQAGNVFNETSGTDLSQVSAWTDITPGTGALVNGPPGISDIAQFDGATLSVPTTFTLNKSTAWAGVAVINPGAPVVIAPGTGSNVLSIGNLGINVGPIQASGGVSQNLTITAPVALGASQLWNVAPTQSLTISGPTLNLGTSGVDIQDSGNIAISANISDTGSGGAIIMAGGGTLTLSGNNTFNGNLVLDSGAISVSSDANLGNANNTITFNGGSLQITGNSLTSLDNHNVQWQSLTGGIDVQSPDNTFTIDQSIGGNATNGGSFSKNGPGTVVMTSTNTYTGPTTINGGALVLSASNTLNTLSTIIVNSAGGLALSNDMALGNPVIDNVPSGQFLTLPDGAVASLTGSVTTGAGDGYSIGSGGILGITGANTVTSPNQTVAFTSGDVFIESNGSLTANLSGLTAIQVGLSSSSSATVFLQDTSRVTNLGNGGLVVADNSEISLQDQSSLNLGAGAVAVGAGSDSTLVVLFGGNLTASAITGGSNAVIVFGGGVLTASANNANFLPTAAAKLELNTGGAIINTNGFAETVNTPVAFDVVNAAAGLTKNGAGQLLLGPQFVGLGSATGPVVVNGGLLEVTHFSQLGSAQSIQINSGGAFGDDEITNFAGLVQFAQSFRPASSPSGALAVTSFFASDGVDYTGSGLGFDMTSGGSTANLLNMSIGAISGAPVAMTGTITPGTNSQTGITTYQLGGGGTLQMVLVNGQSPLKDSSTGTVNVLIENGGAVLLSTTNTYSGTTTIQGANVLTIPAADSPTGANQFQLETTTLQVTNLADGASSIGNSAPGTASNLVINGGVLQYVGAGDTSSRLLTIGQLGATIDSSGQGTLNLQNTGAEAFQGGVAGGLTLTLAGSNLGASVLAASLSNPAGGTLQVIKSGLGTWELAGTNSFTGGTVLNGGTLAVNSDSNLGGTASSITFNGGILQLLSNADGNLDSHAVNWSTFNGGFNLAANSEFTISENIQGTGALDLLGSGIVSLTGNNTYSGGTFIGGGTVQGPATSFGTGSINNNGTLLFLTSAQINGGNISGSGMVYIGEGGSTMTATNVNGPISNNEIGLFGGATLILDFSHSDASQPIISGTGGTLPTLNMAGGNLLIIPNATAAAVQVFASTHFTGASTTTPGIIQNITALGSAGQVTVVLGQYDFGDGSAGFTSINKSATQFGNEVIFHGPLANQGTANPISDFAVLGDTETDAAPLVSVGTNQNGFGSGYYSGFALYGNSDWAAVTTAVNGTSYIVPGSAVSGFYVKASTLAPNTTSPLFLSDGIVAYQLSKQTGTPPNANQNWDIDSPGPIITAGNNAQTSVRFNTPTGGFSTAGGNAMSQYLVPSGSINESCNFLMTANVGATNVLFADLNMVASGLSSGGTQDMNLGRSGAIDATFWNMDYRGNTAGMMIFATGISDSRSQGAGLSLLGPGMFVMAATNSYTNMTNVEGGLLEIATNAGLGGNGTLQNVLSLSAGTLVAINSFAMDNSLFNTGTQLTREVLVGPLGGVIAASNGATLTLDGFIDANGPLTIGMGAFTSVVQGATSTLALTPASGGGTVSLTNAGSVFQGPITVSAGLLRLGVTSLPDLTIAAGATVELGGNSITVNSLSGGGTIKNFVGAPITITVDGSTSTTFSGVIQNFVGAVSLAQAGSGTLTLSGSNTYTGPTNLASGELSISSPANISNTVNFNGGTLQITGTTLQNLNSQAVNWSTFNGGFDIANPSNTFTVSQNITGTGSLLKLGAGTLALTGTNTYTGGTDVEAGTVVITSQSSLGSGPVIDNAQIVFNNPGAVTLTGNLTGSGNLTVSGIGVFLTGNNSYSGSLSVNPGSFFSLDNNNALPPNTALTNNGTLTIANSASQTLASVTGTGTTVVGNSATLTVSGFTQNYLVNSGSVVLGCGGNVGLITGAGELTIGSNNMISVVQMFTNHGSDQLSSLTVVSGSTLDIANHTMTISYGAPANDPVATIAGYLKSGYNGGHWTGTGIVSSIAAAGSAPVLSVGYADGNTDPSTAAGPNQVVVKYTLAGDTNLDGLVNFGDLVAVLQNFNKGNTDWAHGNFGYGISTNFADLVTVLQNFNKTLPFNSSVDEPTNVIPLEGATQVGGAPLGATDVQLPEPNGIVLLVAGTCGLFARRRRKQSSH